MYENPSESQQNKKDKPWIFRTYAGHSNPEETNKLFRANLKKGQTGLSVAFDLPTQTGYDPDHILARGEVGRVGVPIAHLGDMRTLFHKIPLKNMNTSMTINATAPWLLALYIAVAEEQGAQRNQLAGTIQNDIVKEYLARGTYIFPPEPSLRILTDAIAFCNAETPKWNPINVCSYHLQEAGATPVQELAYALETAKTILNKIKMRTDVKKENFPSIVGRMSFFVNAGMKLITEICKLRAFTELWDEICENQYNIKDEKYRRFRYGVQVNSLGLTEEQPENNIHRILIEMIGVVLSKKARARAVQLPAWNEALGLPKKWDQQWSLRAQQILACETDILEYNDIFDGADEIEKTVTKLKEQAKKEMHNIEKQGGIIKAIQNGYMKEQLAIEHAKRLHAIEHEQLQIVGVNIYQETEPSPFNQDDRQKIQNIDQSVEWQHIENLKKWRKSRNEKRVQNALNTLKKDAKNKKNIMNASIEAAKAGATTGEWAQTLREIFGEYRAPTGISNITLTEIKKRHNTKKEKKLIEGVKELSRKLGRKPKILIGKPGLDGHSNGAEQITLKAMQSGFDVIYEGIRLTPENIVNAAQKNNVDIIGLSILSGAHIELAQDIKNQLRNKNLDHIPIFIGGIIQPQDKNILKQIGITQIYTPKDFRITYIIADMIRELNKKYPQAA